MTTKRSCANCDGDLPTTSVGTLCAKCLLTQALEECSRADHEGAPDQQDGIDAFLTRFAAKELPGRFQNKREFARGGMGRILLAWDEQLGRNVAIKEFLSAAGENDDVTPSSSTASKRTMARFLREARITGQLTHPAVVPVHELGYRDDGTLFYVMKHIEGVTLSEAIRSAEGLKARLQLLPHFVDLCQAVAYAHDQGIIHRDLKPANVMIGGYGETVVIDWGLAKSIHTPEASVDAATGEEEGLPACGMLQDTLDGQVVGTPDYMAPEQASGSAGFVDERTDIHALGAVLYTILTGRGPFRATSKEEVLRRLVSESPEPVASIEPHAPPELIAVCERAMAKRPDDRYQTVTDLLEDVQRFLTGGLVSVHSYRFQDHLRRFLRRNVKAVATAAVSFLFLTALTISAYATLLDENAETRAALGRAESNLGLAGQIVDNLLTEVADNELMYLPKMESVRRRLLESAVSYCVQIAARNEDEEGAYHEQTADAQLRLGRLYEVLGQSEDALAALRLAENGFEELLKKEPDVLDHRRKLLDTQLSLGVVLNSLAMYPEARTAFERATSGYADLLSDQSQKMAYEVDFALANYGLAKALDLSGRRPDAYEVIANSRTILEEKVEDSPESYENVQYLTRVLLYKGWMLQKDARWDDATQVFDEAMRLAESLFERRPDLPSHRYMLGRCLNAMYGWEPPKSCTEEEAVAKLEQALDILTRLTDDYPDIANYHRDRLWTMHNLSEKYPDAADRERLLGDCVESAEKLAIENPRNIIFSMVLTSAYGALRGLYADDGRVGEAILKFRSAATLFEAAWAEREASQKRRAEGAAYPRNLGIALNQLALSLETVDKDEALEAALRGVEATERKDGRLLDTLAMILAETGQLQEAVRVQREALELPDDGIDNYSHRKLERHLQRYEQKLNSQQP